MMRESRSVGVVMMATGKYREFVPQAVEAIRERVEGLEEIFLLSDVIPDPAWGVVWLPWGSMKWPYPTLLRYRAMSAYRSKLTSVSYLLYLDVDMKVVGKVAVSEIEGVLAVVHPGYVDVDPENYPYDRNPKSTSYVAVGAGTKYFCGGVQGGQSEVFLMACETIADEIDRDIISGITPLWHDESAWNKYCIECPPGTIWGPEYCVPEQNGARPVGINDKIVAIDKNHGAFRGNHFEAALFSIKRTLRPISHRFKVMLKNR